jgi:hypothetical protein
MKILDPVLVPDVSNWVNHINAREFEDGGCASVIVGLYWILDSNGHWILNPVCRAQCVEVATHSSMVLQGYFWDDIILDPLRQADWLADMLVMEGLPVKWVWADQEQWWSNWAAWYQFRNKVITLDEVPKAAPANISSHNAAFNKRFHERFPNHGVYTNKGFVSSWSPQMDLWLPAYRSWVPHYGRQPKEATVMTWATLKESWLPDYDIILSAGQPAAQVAGHQFTGDACILPGSYTQYNRAQALDVSVFERAFINQIRGGNAPEPLPEPVPIPITPHPAICPTCGQRWPQTDPVYHPKVGYNPNVHVDANAESDVIGMLTRDDVVRVDRSTGLYGHFTVTTEYQGGGWVYMPFMEKV